jgi:hypothetical protein
MLFDLARCATSATTGAWPVMIDGGANR